MIQRYLIPTLISASALTLSACGGSDSSSSTGDGNKAPEAVISGANPNQDASINKSYELKSSASSDDDGDIVSTHWSSEELDIDSGDAEITVNLTQEGTYTVTLTVTDDDGAKDSAKVVFTVTDVPKENEAPSAKISAVNETIYVNLPVTFSAESSSDSDGDIVSYQWSNGKSGSTASKASYTFTETGAQTIHVTVEDDDGAQDEDYLNVMVEEAPCDDCGSAPVAKITPDDVSSVQIDTPITFSASSSTDSDGEIVSYLWSNGSTKESTTFTFDELGSETITLTVKDDDDLSHTSSLSIEVKDEPCCETPVKAVISPSETQTVTAGESLTFSAENSTGEGLSYFWSYDSAPSIEKTTKAITVPFPEEGHFTVSLSVTDEQGSEDVASVSIKVIAADTEAPSVTATPKAGTYTEAQSVTLEISDNEDSAPKLYFTTDGSPASKDSSLYSSGQSIDIPNIVETGVDVVINTLAVDAAGNEAETSFEYTITPSGPVEFPENEFHVNCDGFYNEYSNNLRIYQVMVESFIDGDPNIGYGTGYGTSHHNGDLQGVIDSLDYIKGLGMNAVWMTPVFNSNGSGALDATGYFTQDYFNIDPKWGDMNKIKELVDKAHEKGLYVILDGVFGHYKSNPSTSPTGKTPASTSTCLDKSGSYTAGGGTACADYGQGQTLEYFKEVAEFWVKEVKIDGWRLDQAYQVPIDAWREIRKSVVEASNSVTYTNSEGKEVHPLGYMVAEVWDGGGEYVQSKAFGTESNRGLCSAFDFPLRYSLIQSYAGEEWSATNGKKDMPMTNVVSGFEVANTYPSNARPNLMITNHDLVRIGDLLQRTGIAQPHEDEYWLRHKALFGFMGAYTGPITLYYGDELGQEVPNFDAMREQNGYYDDHVSRDSGRVDGVNHSASGKEKDLMDYITKLMNVRAEEPALHSGERTHLEVGDSATIYADLKQKDGDTILFITNKSNNSTSVTVSTTQMQASGTLSDLIDGSSVSESSGNYNISLEPWQTRYLKAQ